MGEDIVNLVNQFFRAHGLIALACVLMAELQWWVPFSPQLAPHITFTRYKIHCEPPAAKKTETWSKQGFE